MMFDDVGLTYALRTWALLGVTGLWPLVPWQQNSLNCKDIGRIGLKNMLCHTKLPVGPARNRTKSRGLWGQQYKIRAHPVGRVGIMSGDYSLWLKPPAGPTCSKLAQEVAAQAKEFGGPSFEPHVTLLGGVDGDQDTVLEKASSLAGKLKVSWCFGLLLLLS